MCPPILSEIESGRASFELPSKAGSNVRVMRPLTVVCGGAGMLGRKSVAAKPNVLVKTLASTPVETNIVMMAAAQMALRTDWFSIAQCSPFGGLSPFFPVESIGPRAGPREEGNIVG